jgi:molybdopterin-binding protein
MLHDANHPPLPASEANLISGALAKIIPWGGQARVTIDSGVPLLALVSWRIIEELGPQPGQAVVMSFKASDVHVIPHLV